MLLNGEMSGDSQRRPRGIGKADLIGLGIAAIAFGAVLAATHLPDGNRWGIVVGIALVIVGLALLVGRVVRARSRG